MILTFITYNMICHIYGDSIFVNMFYMLNYGMMIISVGYNIHNDIDIFIFSPKRVYYFKKKCY